MYHLYGPLARKHEVWWLSRNDAKTEDSLRNTERMFTRVVAVAVPPEPLRIAGPVTRARAWLGYFMAGYRRPPFPVCEGLRSALGSLLDDSFDAVLVEHEAMAAYVTDRTNDVPWILNTQNIPSVLARRVWQYARGSRERYRSRLACHATLDFEADTFPKFDAVAVVSELERRALKKRFPRIRLFCVPNGVSSDLVHRAVQGQPNGRVLNFTGTFQYEPNRDAIRYFCSAIFPEVLRRDGSVKLQLVGEDSDLMARSLPANLPVTGLGHVNDPLEPLAKCAAVVAPFRLGAGTRIKILEGIAAGRPVIATSVGAEGIELDASCGLLIADDPRDFAEKVLLALCDPGVSHAAQRTGRARVLRDCTWESASSKLEEAVAAVTTSGAHAVRP